MFTLIENGEVYAPNFLGTNSVLLCHDQIIKVGAVDRKSVEEIGVEVDVIDARGSYVTPGFIDPHQHLLGGSGESGFSSQTPEISMSEIVKAGITTVVGCLGADTTMKTLPGLLAKVKGLKEEGLNAYMWSGGYNVPPSCITHSVRDDVMFIDEIIGAGEIAIADPRSSEPTAHELARVAHQVNLAGMLSGKAGVVHIHVGDGRSRLKIVREAIEEHAVEPEWLYVTHVSRSEKLLLEAIALAKDGGYVDLDTVDDSLSECLQFYLDNAGWEEKLTVSSDASMTSPSNLYKQIRSCIVDGKFPIETVLPLVTSNTANALKLAPKGRIEAGKAADILVLTKPGFEIREVISHGRRLVKDGSLNFKEKFLKESNRRIQLEGVKYESEVAANGHHHRPDLFKKRSAVPESFRCDGK
jgi:beta-aspartyl-dipeptidase (metallo-type)